MWILWIQLLLERSLESTYYLCSWKKKPFECDFCNPTSSHKCHIKLHVSSVHEGKKPFKFELCNFESSTKNDLSNHVASIHERKSLYMWNLWEKFALKPYLRKHEAAIHKNKMPI